MEKINHKLIDIELPFRIALIGPMNCGKSYLTRQIIDNIRNIRQEF